MKREFDSPLPPFKKEKMKIRKAKKENFKEIAKIYAEAFSEPPYGESWTNTKALKQINRFSKYCYIWEILYEKILVGFIVINPNFWFPGKFCFVEDIAIKKEFRGKGIGTKVLNNILGIYKKRGFKKLIMITNIKSRAYKLYKKIGILPSKEDILIERSLK